MAEATQPTKPEAAKPETPAPAPQPSLSEAVLASRQSRQTTELKSRQDAEVAALAQQQAIDKTGLVALETRMDDVKAEREAERAKEKADPDHPRWRQMRK